MKSTLIGIASFIALVEGFGLVSLYNRNEELVQENECLYRSNRYLKANYCTALRALDICGVHAGYGLVIDIDSLPDYQRNERDKAYRKAVDEAEHTAVTLIFDNISF